ncbi:hypothetical protein GUJ93_ZPchr0001g31702 [Zizania palustris]|uniref:Uncharacterized protein n=1 Tax=Zizania palustris TaxID=103762 RepID=A0A8J5VM93_ZIZPA|nr:hypothetical protein GUJ93_ZPchr0001g31702 [Zizania palustris]
MCGWRMDDARMGCGRCGYCALGGHGAHSGSAALDLAQARLGGVQIWLCRRGKGEMCGARLGRGVQT